jgi:hypothetical protein
MMEIETVYHKEPLVKKVAYMLINQHILKLAKIKNLTLITLRLKLEF